MTGNLEIITIVAGAGLGALIGGAGCLIGWLAMGASWWMLIVMAVAVLVGGLCGFWLR